MFTQIDLERIDDEKRREMGRCVDLERIDRREENESEENHVKCAGFVGGVPARAWSMLETNYVLCWRADASTDSVF